MVRARTRGTALPGQKKTLGGKLFRQIQLRLGTVRMEDSELEDVQSGSAGNHAPSGGAYRGQAALAHHEFQRPAFQLPDRAIAFHECAWLMCHERIAQPQDVAGRKKGRSVVLRRVLMDEPVPVVNLSPLATVSRLPAGCGTRSVSQNGWVRRTFLPC